jgi:hypothetical protein
MMTLGDILSVRRLEACEFTYVEYAEVQPGQFSGRLVEVAENFPLIYLGDCNVRGVSLCWVMFPSGRVSRVLDFRFEGCLQ